MKQNKKYKFDLEDTIKIEGHKLYRIIALRSFSNVEEGDKGGYIESENNLSHQDDCWVYDNAAVYGYARVCGYAAVCGYARVCGYAAVCGYARVYGDTDVYGNAVACGDAVIKNDRDYIVFKNFWSSGRYFTWTRSNNKWRAGCFYGTAEELIRKAYDESQEKGREYERVVRYVESILADEERDKEPSKTTTNTMNTAELLRQEMKLNAPFLKEELIQDISKSIKHYGKAQYLCHGRVANTKLHHSCIAPKDEPIAREWAKEEGFHCRESYNSHGARMIVFNI